MFSIVCRFVLSDQKEDANYRRTNPAAKSYPGLFYHLKYFQFREIVLINDFLFITGLLHNLSETDGEDKPLLDADVIEVLVGRCSRATTLEKRTEAGLELLRELTIEKENDDMTEENEGNTGEEDNGKDAYEDMHPF